MRKVTLYIAMSVDGYIAGPGDNLRFLRSVEKKGEDYGYQDFISTVDTVVLGRRTYDWLMAHVGKFPHADKETFVITSAEKESAGNINYYNGDLRTLITSLKQKTGGTIFIDGGAQLVNTLLKHDLIDEFIVSVIPVMLGDGIKLFNGDRPEMKLTQKYARSFDTGLVQLAYQRKQA